MDASKKLESISVEASGVLAAVADPVRWRLLAHLTSGHSTCVCDLQLIAAVAPNLLSYHLKVLRETGLVTTARRGRWVDYTIAADALERLHAALPTPTSAPAPALTSAPAPTTPAASDDRPTITRSGSRTTFPLMTTAGKQR